MLAPFQLIFITALAALICLGVLGSFARSGIPGVKEAIRANILTLSALAVFYALRFWPSRPALVLGNLIYLLGTCAYYVGLCRFLERKPLCKTLAAAVLIATTANALFMFVWPSTNVRIVAASGVHTVLFACIFTLLWRTMPYASMRYGHLFTLTVILIGLAGHAIRTAVYALGIESLGSMAESLPWNLAFLMLGVLIMPAMLLGFIIMVQSRLLDDRQREADTDSLTSLLTRKAWRREVMPRHASVDGGIAILLVDIDHFKLINDLHGHAAGDCVLRHFADHLSRAAGEGSLTSRWGGEEFAIALPGATAQQACLVGQRLQRVLSESPCRYEDQVLTYTFSGGQTQWCEGESLDEALRRADQALYAAKQDGRDRLQQAELLPLAG
jgi:diguanylate cyclase (GGDEF)-like protein